MVASYGSAKSRLIENYVSILIFEVCLFPVWNSLQKNVGLTYSSRTHLSVS